MKKFNRILSDIALVLCVLFFIAFLINVFTAKDFYFGLSTFILFGVCFIYFIFSKNKKNAFVDIWNLLEIIFDWF